MIKSFREGISFGMTSGVITTLGLMTGLDAATSSKFVVAAGIISIAFADAFSDALGIHLLEETAGRTAKKIWQAMTATFFAKLIVALTFLVPVYFLQLKTALIAAVVWGLFLITILSHEIARKNRERAKKVIAEHIGLAIVVLIVSYAVGTLVSIVF